MALAFRTQREARRFFILHLVPNIRTRYESLDTAALNEEWGQWLDEMHKAGKITDRAYRTWTRGEEDPKAPAQKYNVMMYHKGLQSWVCMEHNGRIAWGKKQAMKHLHDVRNSAVYTHFYSDFKLAED